MQYNNQISAEKLKRNSFVLLKMQVFIPPILTNPMRKVENNYIRSDCLR